MERLYAEFGRRVRQLRKDAGLTQDQLARRIGLARTSITNIELGQQHIPIHLLYPLASALGVTPAMLLPKAEFATTASPQISPDVASELEKQELSPSTRRWIERLVMKADVTSQGEPDEPGEARAKGTKRPRSTGAPNSG